MRTKSLDRHSDFYFSIGVLLFLAVAFLAA